MKKPTEVKTNLFVYSIFASVDGEVNAFHQGALTIFLRLSGCNLRCSYCDTKYAQQKKSGKEMTIPQIMDGITSTDFAGIRKVTITGGEPLLQRDGLHQLLHLLWLQKYKVTIETNGSQLTYGYSPYARLVVDYKLKSSGVTKHMNEKAFLALQQGDFIKFVIGSEEDYEQAMNVWRKFHAKIPGVGWAFSPSFGAVSPGRLAGWMLQDPIPGAVLNVQLHKIIDLSEPQ